MKETNFDLQSFISNPPEEFAIIEHPDQQLEICLGPFESSETLIDSQKNLFFCDFFLSVERKFLLPTNTIFINSQQRSRLQELMPKTENLNMATGIAWHALDEKLFKDTFNFYKSAISKAELVKAVPVSFLQGSCQVSETILPQLLLKLVQGQNGLYSYAIRRNGFLMLGASPEILFNFDSTRNIISSEAVAGSILGPSAPIKQITEKLLEEQQLVVDDLSKQLSSFGTVSVSEVKLKNLSSLCHVKSDILTSCQTNVNAMELIRSLHPSGALGLLPRKELSNPLLLNLDPSHIRQAFGAPFGIIHADGSAQIIVAIRNLILHKGQIKIGAGVGITAKSDFEAELQEIKAKHSAVKNFFGLNEIK